MLLKGLLRRMGLSSAQTLLGSLLLPPDAAVTLEYLQEALVEVAKHNKEAPDIYHCLLSDHLYCINMSCIVSHYISIMKVADILSSLVHTFPFSARKSRTAVLQLYRLNSWPFRLSWRSCTWPKNNCCLIITHFQEQAR